MDLKNPLPVQLLNNFYNGALLSEFLHFSDRLRFKIHCSCHTYCCYCHNFAPHLQLAWYSNSTT